MTAVRELTARAAIEWLLSDESPDWRLPEDRARKKSLLALGRASGVPDRRLRRWKAGANPEPANADDFLQYGIRLTTPRVEAEDVASLTRRVEVLEAKLRELAPEDSPAEQASEQG